MLNFPFVCRLCLIPTSPNNSIEIFDESNEIPDKILELTDIQVARGMPATVSVGAATPSYGTQFQTDFNNNLAAVMNNLHNGATTLATPPIKLGLDTLPNLIHQGITTATDKMNKITAASKEGLQKMGMGAGQALVGGGVLGSSIAGGAMTVAGHGLGVGVNVADAGAKAGIDLLGHAGDNAASSIAVGTTIGGNALSTLGNGMIAAGTGVNVMSNGLATLLDVIGSRLSGGINKAEQVIAGLMDSGVLKLENGVLSFSSTAQANVYNILNSFLQILINVQKLFDSLRLSINTQGSVNTATSGAANTATSGAANTMTSGAAGGTTAAQTGTTTAKSVRSMEDSDVEEVQAEEGESTAQVDKIDTSSKIVEAETSAQTESETVPEIENILADTTPEETKQLELEAEDDKTDTEN